jgi:Zn finger protein HypA/HybF involved in hydrogenase expression
MRATLLQAIKNYAQAQFGTAIDYSATVYPYWMIAGTTTKYPDWSARLLRAAYNYQFSVKDPGAFAHNGKYIVQLLYDSISDLNSKLSTLAVPSPVPNFANLKRNDPGHFDSSAEALAHWDQDEAVSASCARCHSVEGFQFVAKYGIDQTIAANLVSGFSCEMCHVKGTSFAPRAQNPNPGQIPELVYVKSVAFPYPTTATSTQIAGVTIKNGAVGTAAQDDSFICMTCHRARQSTLTLDAADLGGLVTNFTLSTPSPHYLQAGATLYGSKAATMYQYAGKTYVQRWDHDSGYNTPYAEASGLPTTPAAAKAQCAYCHMENGSHSFEVELTAACTACHSGTATIADLVPAFRAQDNFDGDAATKPKAETAAFAARLHTAIQDYAKAAKTAGTTGAEWTIFYNADNPASTASKGFYKDLDHSGVLEVSELTSSNSSKWDSKGYRATFNYRFWVNEPGAWAHNPKYVLQVFYDAILDLGGDVTGLTRP